MAVFVSSDWSCIWSVVLMMTGGPHTHSALVFWVCCAMKLKHSLCDQKSEVFLNLLHYSFLSKAEGRDSSGDVLHHRSVCALHCQDMANSFVSISIFTLKINNEDSVIIH